MDAYLGTILPWAPSYAPNGWLFCQGQDLAINQYNALYALIGTTYGQSNSATFKLPNLSGRVPVGAGYFSNNGTQIPFNQGQVNGALQTNLAPTQVPVAPHTHTITNTAAVTGGLTGTVSMDIKIPINTDNQPATPPVPPTYVNTPSVTTTLGQAKAAAMAANLYTTNPPTAGVNLKPFTATGTTTVSAPTITVTSQCAQASLPATQAVSLMQPYLVINYIICLQGLWPDRP